jgi:MFS family permease
MKLVQVKLLIISIHRELKLENTAVLKNRLNLTTSELDSTKAWLVCHSAALFFFYDFIQMMMCNALSDVLIQEFSIDASGLGILASSFLLSDVLFLFPAGLIIDRVSTRKVTIVMLALSIVGALGLALTTSFKLACVFRFIAGIAHAFCFLCCVSFATRWFSPNRQAFVIGLIVTIAMCGGLVAQTPLSLLSDSIGWRNALLANVGLGLLVLMLVYMFVQDYPSEKALENELYHNQLSEMGFLKSLSKAVSNGQNWLLGIYTGLMNLPIMIIGGLFGVMYLTAVFGLSKTDATLVSSMVFLGTIFGAPLAGKVSDTLEKKRLPMIVSCVISMGILYTIMYTNTFGFYPLIILFFALGLFTSSQVISYPAINENNPQSISSTSMGLAAVIIMGLGGFFQYYSGVLLDRAWDGTMVNSTPIYSKEHFLYALSVLSIGLVVSLVATLFVRETNCKPVAPK